MRMLDRAFLHHTFLAGLATATSACASAPKTPFVPEPSPFTLRAQPVDLASLPPEAAGELKQEATSFHAVQPLAAGVTKVEVIAFADVVTVPSDGPYVAHEIVCDPEPCTAEIKALGDAVPGRRLIVREGGKVRAVSESEFTEVFGPVDSPEKAALRLAVSPENRMILGRCSDFEAYGAACAAGSDSAGVPVRAAEGGFDVVSFGETNVCGDGSFGNGRAFRVAHVTSAGELQFPASPITKWSEAVAMPGAHCQVIMLGRMFEGYVDLPRATSLLDYFVRGHRQEAAAVVAFERLAAELRAFGAPEALIEAARRGASDEREHARLFAEQAHCLATKLGIEAELAEAETAPFQSRSLFALLLENVLEGCANETLAAAIATYQAEAPEGLAASRPELCEMFARIAEDERSHAALAFAIHAWGRDLLDEGARNALDVAYRSAIGGMTAFEPSTIGHSVGEPSPECARLAFLHIAEGLDRAAFSKPRAANQGALSS